MSNIVSDKWPEFELSYTNIFLVRLYAKMTESSGCYTVDLVNIMRSCIIKSCKNSSRKVKDTDK